MFDEERSSIILNQAVPNFPPTVVILGSGWNEILAGAEIETEIPYERLFGASSTVPGHDGKLVIAKIGGERTALMSGRFHAYEGFSTRETTAPIRILHAAGMNRLIITASCGGLNEQLKVGDFLILSDINTLFLGSDNPLAGARFVDVSEVFSPELRHRAKECSRDRGIPFQEGVYVYYHGPNYETPADKRALRLLGADAVGMSVVPEVLMARALNIETLGLAYVTNLAFVVHDHREVIAQAKRGGAQMASLLAGILERNASSRRPGVQLFPDTGDIE